MVWKLGVFLLFVFPPFLELLLGAFAKQLCGMPIGFMMSVCFPVCLSSWNNLAPTGWMLMKYSIQDF
jgi:hypothetical protein